MRAAGHLNYLTREHLKSIIRPGITTREIDEAAGEFIEAHGGIPNVQR